MPADSSAPRRGGNEPTQPTCNLGYYGCSTASCRDAGMCIMRARDGVHWTESTTYASDIPAALSDAERHSGDRELPVLDLDALTAVEILQLRIRLSELRRAHPDGDQRP